MKNGIPNMATFSMFLKPWMSIDSYSLTSVSLAIFLQVKGLSTLVESNRSLFPYPIQFY
jgi:hypothetical protein